MAAEDYMPADWDGFFDSDAEHGGYGFREDPVCKFCGSHEVTWMQPDLGRWVLHNNNGSRHYCQHVPAVTSDFDDETGEDLV